MVNFKQNWKTVMTGALGFMFLGFVLAVCSFKFHVLWGMYAGLGLIVSVCISWWFWVMYVIKSMISQTEKTARQIKEVGAGITEVKILVKEYAKLTGVSDRKRRKSTTIKSTPITD